MTVEPIGAQLARIREKAEQRQAEAPPDDPVAQVERVERAKDQARERRLSVLDQQWREFVPDKYADADPRDFDGESRKAISRWRGREGAWVDGVNLLIAGPVGSGKTRAAFAAARGPFMEGATVGFWPEAELKEALDWHNPDASKTMRSISTVEVLILDDLGIDPPNDWWTSKLYAVVNRRWLDDAPTIATTNLGPRDLAEAVGARTYSRLADHPIGVRLTGEDRRRAR